MHDVLSDNRIVARPLSADDVHDLHAAVRESMDTVGPWMAWCHPGYSLSDAHDWVNKSAQHWASDGDREFGIFDAASARLLGCAGINQMNALYNFANCGYWVRKSSTNRGVATAVVRLLARFAFDRLGLTRVEIVARVDNIASRRVAEKAGCTFECVARNRLVQHGQPHHAAMYSLIPADLER
ncbi:MAG: GNAT family N-acetyltransferase [Pseudomonadota bacterium]|nr:GNAT family N-acetyltransferase [Pseudomonadota bacterium]